MSSQPLGIIVAYMGELATLTELVDDDGCAWLLCDGNNADAGRYENLYNVIGDTFGVSTVPNTFKLPNLQGQFVRVLDLDSNNNTSGRDKNIPLERVPPVIAAPQSYIGSVQLDAVPHDHNLSGWNQANESDQSRNMMCDDDPSDVCGWTDPAGGSETRPRNVALNFIIRASNPPSTATASDDSGLPVGSIVYFTQSGAPVTDNNESWYACDGTTATAQRFTDDQDSQRTELFQALGTAFGEGDGTKTYGLPDLRGYFLRGVDDGAGVDPDAGARTPTNPNLKPDQVGSYQSPALTDHSHGIENTYGTDPGMDHSIKLNGNNPPNWHYQTYLTFHQTRAAQRSNPFLGSDIRPINIALTAALLSGPSMEHIPIGSIVAYGGSVDPTPAGGETWVMCKGQPLNAASSEYQTLFNALFPQGSAPPLQAPDLRGRFIRGLDPTAATDFDVASRTAMFSNGLLGAVPTTLQSDQYGQHMHALTSGHYLLHDGGSDTQAVSADSDGGDSGGPTDGVINQAISAETRPLNMYLNFIVRIS